MDLVHGGIRLRPLRLRDRVAWDDLRMRNAGWLRPWEATSPEANAFRPTFAQYVRGQNRAARRGEGYAAVIEVDRRMVGQLTVSSVTRGSLQSATIGYWIAEEMAGRGIVPVCVALATDYCFLELGLHRVEINIRPENAASLRVVAKLGFRDEGIRERYLHINGTWADHRTFALTVEEARGGLTARLP
ncbi:N-acetyltransferase [Occultella glacieicola]|uniref:N-acetyltransferase n=1 Tax=Occultella glacieicola TaxID=2518684 RepID=A0ABY2E394_9MICO|nr:GNAT family protein [Occultella glacieicola]TDE94094.1 N-acetyltransferase [Occultella glacieicola]